LQGTGDKASPPPGLVNAHMHDGGEKWLTDCYIPVMDMESDIGAPGASGEMIDPFGRAVTYLRVSVTDRCDFRCTYCMAEHMTFLPKKDLLTLEELDRVCSAFIRKGVRKLRLTGGEPLVRRDVMTLVKSLGRHLETGALDELTLTSNGSQLARFADDLYAAGVRRVNVSLDTLKEDLFHRITRWGRLPRPRNAPASR